jgi:hypothetical protein
MPVAQTRGLFLVMLRWCLSDSTIQQSAVALKIQPQYPHVAEVPARVPGDLADDCDSALLDLD